jgi:hypothetical protein
MKETVQLLQVSPVMVHGATTQASSPPARSTSTRSFVDALCGAICSGRPVTVEEFASAWANARAADPSEAVAECRAPATSANDAALGVGIAGAA